MGWPPSGCGISEESSRFCMSCNLTYSLWGQLFKIPPFEAIAQRSNPQILGQILTLVLSLKTPHDVMVLGSIHRTHHLQPCLRSQLHRVRNFVSSPSAISEDSVTSLNDFVSNAMSSLCSFFSEMVSIDSRAYGQGLRDFFAYLVVLLTGFGVIPGNSLLAFS